MLTALKMGTIMLRSQRMGSEVPRGTLYDTVATLTLHSLPYSVQMRLTSVFSEQMRAGAGILA
jgi:hypothetical protein